MKSEDIFEEIYATADWGGEEGEFYSGIGSDEPYASQYAATVNRFIEAHQITSVVDVGCGDFRIGGLIAKPTLNYVGIDVASRLIARNQDAFSNSHVSFRCLNAEADELPNAELCLIRQVLQHLSNDRIQQLLNNTRQYRFRIITEHLPPNSELFIPNKDFPTGANTRARMHSGVLPHLPPFSLDPPQILLEADLSPLGYPQGERLITMLFTS